MKIIDATWEKRNLGVSCTEIEIEKSDDSDEIRNSLSFIDNEYIVLKIPYGMTDAGFIAQDFGFKYIESNIQLELRMKEKPELPSIYKRYEPFIDIHEASSEEITMVLDEIRSGRVFTTDKVALDPFFSPEKSGYRYACWTEDLLKSGKCRINVSTYKNERIAFGIIVDKGSYYDAFLGGLFSDKQIGGLGFLSVYTNTLGIYDFGGRHIKTGVSSNNLPILKLHMLYNYSISNLFSTFIKHKTI